MLGLPSGLTAGYTGHLYAGRGIGLLEKLAQEFPQVNFLWVGGLPDDVDAWRRRLEAQGLQNVTLVGFVKNYRLPLYQAAADVLLMPYERSIAGSSGGDSAAYASPMKMFEYMACRRAILSSDLPVVREVIGEQNAVLCPPDDLPAWSQALRGLLAEDGLRQRLAQQAWQDVQQYTWEARARRSLEGLA
jgi:glycosyltransferase involved in cell wall biosynthesis